MTTPFFKTPAFQQDFKDPASYQKWSKWISDQNSTNIRDLKEIYPELTACQYYHPEKTIVQDTEDAVVSWNAFPLRIQKHFTPGSDEMYKAAETAVKVEDDPFLQGYYGRNWKLFKDVRNRVQDEYLEWFAHHDEKGNLVRVDLSCEGPEYWKKMYKYEKQTLLELYQKFHGDAVTMADLEWIKPGEHEISYNSANKWNTTHGIMHLNCPPNSLSAEINLAAFATVLRGSGTEQVTDPQKLIQCARYGDPNRNSDPHIGATVNQACSIKGTVITCTNPVGLYIQEIKTDGWAYKGNPISKADKEKIVTIERGYAPDSPLDPGRILRIRVEVPKELGYKLSDITIGPKPIKFGGQIAEGITMSLAATIGTIDIPKQPLQGCEVPQHSFAMHEGVLQAVGLNTKRRFVSLR